MTGQEQAVCNSQTTYNQP